jgi:hypothetical protein
MSDWRAIAAALSALLFVAGCGAGETDRGVWFVHATDPHLFEESEGSEPERLSRERESLEAFEQLLATFDALPDIDAEPAFLLLTGDFGIGEEPADGDTREARVEILADALAERPGLTVYFVPGNNDIAGELIGNVGAADEFLDAVRTRVRPQGVDLHDLTACYRAGAGILDGCTFDIPGTRFRLIGFPTFSFKEPKQAAEERPGGEEERPDEEEPTAAPTAGEADAAPAQPVAESPAPAAGEPPAASAETPVTSPTPAAPPTGRDEVHGQWIERLGLLVSEARRERKKALIATHIPDLNDPYDQAQGELYRLTARTASGGPVWSPWSVTPELYERWRAIVDSPTVSRVLAGHFHDNHKEIYRQPYSWERDPPGAAPFARPDRGKLWIAPPLGVRLQDASPIQARGFALVGLIDGQPVRRLYWYDQARRAFEPEEPAGPRQKRDGGGEWWLRGWAARLWDLGGAASALEKMVILLFALTAAFLTIVAVWKIPPPDTRWTQVGSAEAVTPAPPAAAAGGGPFDNNFARTVLGGLSGLVGIAFVDAFWEGSPVDHKAYYIVCFLIFFLLVLLVSSFLRAVAETLRSRVVGEHRHGRPRRDSPPEKLLLYWGRRLWRWILSHRASSLVFFDTFLNLIQGRNQLQTKVFGDEIFELQRSLVGTVDRIAEEIERAIRHALDHAGCAPGRMDCRVNISVMSNDGQSLQYVSLGRGSLLRPFGPRSIAWLATTLGRAMWWRKGYEPDADDIELFDNSKNSNEPTSTLAGWEKSIKLKSVFAPRGTPDYEAFVVIPLPWLRGHRTTPKSAIHISLAKEQYLDKLWAGLELPSGVVEPSEPTQFPEPTQPADLVGEAARNRGVKQIEERFSEWRSLISLRFDCDGDEKSRNVIQPRDHQVNAVLVMALAVLPEVLRNFNRSLFEDLIKPR